MRKTGADCRKTASKGAAKGRDPDEGSADGCNVLCVWTAWHPAGRSSGEGGKSKADSRVSYICIASLTGVPPDYSDTLSRRYDFLLQGVS